MQLQRQSVRPGQQLLSSVWEEVSALIREKRGNLLPEHIADPRDIFLLLLKTNADEPHLDVWFYSTLHALIEGVQACEVPDDSLTKLGALARFANLLKRMDEDAAVLSWPQAVNHTFYSKVRAAEAYIVKEERCVTIPL